MMFVSMLEQPEVENVVTKVKGRAGSGGVYECSTVLKVYFVRVSASVLYE